MPTRRIAGCANASGLPARSSWRIWQYGATEDGDPIARMNSPSLSRETGLDKFLYDRRRARRLANLSLFTHTLPNQRLGGIMFAFAVRSGDFQLSSLFAIALSVWMWPAASRAYTAEEEQACSGDAFRLCSAEIPDVDRVTACMVRRQSQLSPGCRVYFRPEGELTPVAVTRPLSITPARVRKPVSARPHKPKKPARPGVS